MGDQKSVFIGHLQRGGAAADGGGSTAWVVVPVAIAGCMDSARPRVRARVRMVEGIILIIEAGTERYIRSQMALSLLFMFIALARSWSIEDTIEETSVCSRKLVKRACFV